MEVQEKKFYWLQLKNDFFKRHEIQIVEAMPNGKDYILFYLKLLCESVAYEGNLRFNRSIPYNENMLSVITNTNVDIVRSAVKIFGELDMMEIMDDGTYFMREVTEMIGSAANNSNANRQRRHRERKKQQEALLECNESVTKSNACVTPTVTDSLQNITIVKNTVKDTVKDRDINCADAQNTDEKPKAKPTDSDFWKFAKENAELAKTFYEATGIYPVKSQFGRWVNDLRDLAEAGISAEQLRKTIAYMQSENITISAPGSCLKTAQWLKARGCVPVRTRQNQIVNEFPDMYTRMLALQEAGEI